MPHALFEKLWEDAHIVRYLGGGWALLHIDRHLLHESIYFARPAIFSAR